MAKQIQELPKLEEVGLAEEIPIVNKDENKTYKMQYAQLIDLIFPVGSLIYTVTEQSPIDSYGGVWERFATGTTILGVDENDTDFDLPELLGGEQKHTLTTAEMPAHTHIQKVTSNSGSANRKDYKTDGATTRYTQGINNGIAGSGTAHNNMQPYITTYVWKRTA